MDEGSDPTMSPVAQRITDLLTLVDQATGNERVDLLRRAVETGMQLWTAELNGERPVAWWIDVDTRPFMIAVMAYGQALAAQGDHRRAAFCFKSLLAIHPQDLIGAQAELHKLPFWFDATAARTGVHLAESAIKN